MNLQLLSFLPLLLPGFALVSGEDEEVQEPTTLVRYDLRPVSPRFDTASSWVETLSPRVVEWNMEERVELGSLYTPAPPEVVLDVVTRILGDALLEKGRSISLDGESALLVLAPRAVQDEIAAILDALARAMSSAERLRVDVLILPQAGDGDLLDKAMLTVSEATALTAELVGRGATHRSHVLELLPGRTVVHDQTRSVPFLADYDIEIATGSIAFDPIIAELREGLRILARGARTAGGLALSLALESSALDGEVAERTTRLRGGVGNPMEGGMQVIDGPAGLETAELVTRAVAFSTLIGDGQVAALASESNLGGKGERMVVLLRSEVASSGPFHRASFGTVSLELVNGEVFTLPSLGFGYGDDDGFSSAHVHHPALTARLDSAPSGFLFDWLKYRFSVQRRIGPWAVIVTDPAWDNQAAQELGRLLGSLAAPGEVTRTAVALVDGKGTSLVRWSLPVLTGTRCGAWLGRSTTLLADYDVEVAQYATAADPIVVPVFEGLSFSLGVSAGAQRLVEARGVGQKLVRPIGGRGESATPSGPFAGAVERATVETIEFDERARLDATGKLVAGAGAERPNDAPGLRVEVSMR